jgi:hypothetical protein
VKKPAPKATPKPAAAASPTFDPNKPFQQRWSDAQISPALSKAADSLLHAKQILAHSYITSTVDVTAIATSFKDVPFDSFVYKAAAKAFKETVNAHTLSIQRIHSLEKRDIFANATDLRVSQFKPTAQPQGQQISIHRIAQST